LIPYNISSVEEEKGRYISFELKTRVSQPSDATRYKKFARKFEVGSPQEWIDMLKDLEEIWTQNSMTGGTDRASTVRALVRGESTVEFQTALQDARVRAKPQLSIQKEKKSFTNQNLRNEINLLSKQSSKKKILEMYSSVIRREQAKLEEERPQKRKKIIAPESESNNKMSVQVISAPKKKVVKKLRKRTSDNTDVLAEEREYQKKLKWLKDHRDLTRDEGNNPGNESSGNEASYT
jgi:hypothetical protein